MALQAIAGLANIGLSAIPLFAGENNIFSGKGRQANRELERTFRAGQSMSDVPAEMQRVLQQRQMRQNQGLGSAALGLYNREAQRGMATAFGQLQDRRSALAGVGDIVGASQDAALKLAGMEEQARMGNIAAAEQAAMNVGQMRQQSQLRKLDEASQYWGTRKAESNAAISGALRGMGQAAGSALAFGAFDKTNTQPTGGMTPNQAANYAQNQALARQQFQGLASTGLSSWGPLSPKALRWTPPSPYSPKIN